MRVLILYYSVLLLILLIIIKVPYNIAIIKSMSIPLFIGSPGGGGAGGGTICIKVIFIY
jgi:hypothetical protein